MDKILAEKKVEISSREYNLLKAAYEQLKKQGAILRIFEAEENLKKGRVKTMPFKKFIENI